MTFETFKNLLFAFDRLERMTPAEKASSRSNQTLHKILGEFLFSEETIRHFATEYSSWLTDGSRESGEWARKYFDLVQAQRPGALLGAIEAYDKGTHFRLSTLRFWMTRSKEDFRSVIFSIDWSSRYNGIGFLFDGPIGSFDGFQFLRRHPDLIVDVVQIELRKNAPYGYSQGSVLEAARAVVNIEADTKEHQLVERLRLRSQNAMYLNATINNAYLLAGEPTNSNFFRFGETVTANQEMQKLVSEEMKKLGMSSIDPRKLAKAVSDISKGLNGPHLLSALRRKFGNERIDAIVRASFVASAEFSRRAPMLASTTSTYDKEERMTSTRRSDVRTGALVELLARNQFTLADFDVLVRDLGQGINWINPLVRAYDTEVLRTLQSQIRKLLYEAGYQDGAGLARYLREKHNLELVMDEKREAAIRQTSERAKAEGNNKLLSYDVADDSEKLVDRVTKKPGASPAEVLLLFGALRVATTDRDPHSKLHYKMYGAHYDAKDVDDRLRIANDFIKESLGNWYRQNPAVVGRIMQQDSPPKSLIERARTAFVGTKSCEAAFVSTK